MSKNIDQVYTANPVTTVTDTMLNYIGTSGVDGACQMVALKAYVNSTGVVTSVSGTAGHISSTGGNTPVIDLVPTAVTPGSYTYSSFTVDSDGRLTAASNGTAPVTSVSGTAGDISSTGGTTPVLDLISTAVTPGAYTNSSFTVDAKGRITAAANGTAPVLSVTGTASDISSTGGQNPVLDLISTAVTPGSYTATNLTVDAKGRITAASNGSSGAPSSPANSAYVDYINGVDSVGRGGLANPYATVAYAQSQITTATAASKWIIFVTNSNASTEVSVALKPFIDIKGYGKDTTIWKVTTLSPAASFLSTNNAVVNISDLFLTNSTTLTFTGGTGTGTNKINFTNCLTNAVSLVNATVGYNIQVSMDGSCYANNNITAGANTTLLANDSYFSASVVGTSSTLQFENCTVNNFFLSGTGSAAIYNTNVQSNSTVSGSNFVVQTDLTSNFNYLLTSGATAAQIEDTTYLPSGHMWVGNGSSNPEVVPPTSFQPFAIFQPGGTTNLLTNTFTSFSALTSFLYGLNHQGEVTIYFDQAFDGTLPIPTGTYNFPSSVRFVGIGSFATPTLAANVIFAFPNSAYNLTFYNIAFSNNASSTIPLITVDAQSNGTLITLIDSNLSASSGSHNPGNSAIYITNSASVFIYMYGSSALSSAGTVPAITFDTNGYNVPIFMYNQSEIFIHGADSNNVLLIPELGSIIDPSFYTASVNWPLGSACYSPGIISNDASSQRLTQTWFGGSSYNIRWPNSQGAASTVLTNNGSGSLSWATPAGGFTWVDQTSSSVTMAANTGYITDNGASLVTYTLPTTAALGAEFKISGKSSGKWKIAQNAGQAIIIDTKTSITGTGGSVSALNANDCIYFVCTTANTFFTAQYSSNVTVV